jgi:hypothetical protein
MDRHRYLDDLRAVLRPGGQLFALCYSDQDTTKPIPPHRLSRNDIESCFADGWTVESIRAATSASTGHAGGVAAWLATCTRI